MMQCFQGKEKVLNMGRVFKGSVIGALLYALPVVIEGFFLTLRPKYDLPIVISDLQQARYLKQCISKWARSKYKPCGLSMGLAVYDDEQGERCLDNARRGVSD